MVELRVSSYISSLYLTVNFLVVSVRDYFEQFPCILQYTIL